MKTKSTFFVLSLLAAPIFAIPSLASVEVIFQDAEKFTDVRQTFSGTDREREGYLGVIKEYIEKQAPRHLADGQSLSITFTNIDMAGDFEGNPDIRLIKSIYPARMDFSFRVTDSTGAVVKEGSRKLIDTVFQMRGGPTSNREGLFYEKSLLQDWLREEFGRPRKK